MQSTLPPVRSPRTPRSDSPRTPRSPGQHDSGFAATFANLHGQEHEARRRYAAAQRRLLTMTNQHVTEMVHKRNRAAALEVRRSMDEWTGKALRRHFRDVTPAGEKEVAEMSVLFNNKLGRLYPESRSHQWFRLFTFMDDDNSGLVSYPEFRKMVRDELYLDNIRDAKIEALWRALDEDNSGQICGGEFGKFMRIGYAGWGEAQLEAQAARPRPLWRDPGVNATDKEAEEQLLVDNKRHHMQSVQRSMTDKVRKIEELARQLEEKERALLATRGGPGAGGSRGSTRGSTGGAFDEARAAANEASFGNRRGTPNSHPPDGGRRPSGMPGSPRRPSTVASRPGALASLARPPAQ